MNEKNADKIYKCAKVSTAVKHAIADGIIVLDYDIDRFTLDGLVYEATETGKANTFWKTEKEFFRMNIERLSEHEIYIDIGYRTFSE